MASVRPVLVRGLTSLGDLAGPSAVLAVDGRIAALDAEAVRAAPPDAIAIDGAGLACAPGFIELQINGIGGRDFTTDPAAMHEVGPRLARHGITAFLPTIVTAPGGAVEQALAAWRSRAAPVGLPVPLGLHVEGPFLAPGRRGAHDPSHLRRPDLVEIAGWLDAGGLRILTLAPELPGGLEAVALVRAAGAVAAVGHTEADLGTTRRAIEAGARYATHLFNAMPPLGHRDPGAVGALLADERVTIGLIVDGTHLDPTAVAVVARLAAGRLSLVSDAIAALDGGDGPHRLGGREVHVRDGAARLGDGTPAGSVVGLDACVRAFAALTGSVRAAVEAVTAVPARLLGLTDGRGCLRVGGRADLVLLDPALQVRATLVGGAVAWEART